MSSQPQTCEPLDVLGTSGEDRLIPVLFASTNSEAGRLCALLEEVNILAVPGDHTGAATKGLGVPILVPRSLFELSSEILASTEAVGADRDFEDDEDDDEDEDDFFPDDPDDNGLDDDEDDEFVDDDGDGKSSAIFESTG